MVGYKKQPWASIIHDTILVHEMSLKCEDLTLGKAIWGHSEVFCAQQGMRFFSSCSAYQVMANGESIRKHCLNIDLAAILEYPAQTGLLQPELPLWPPGNFVSITRNRCSPFERMWATASRSRSVYGPLNQTITPPFWRLRQRLPLPRPHRKSEDVREICCRCQVTPVGSGHLLRGK
jgi:hypothetical protein